MNSRTLWHSERTRFTGVLVVEIPSGDKIGMAFATAVGTYVSLSRSIGVIVAALADFGFAGILGAEGTARMEEHALWEILLLL